MKIKNINYKSLLKVALPLFALALSSNAHAVKWIGEGGVHFGGDNLATATFTNGDTKDINAGALLSVGIGPQIDITENSNVRVLFNYKTDSISAQNGNLSFTRFPIDVMYFYTTEQWLFGGGITYHLNPELMGDGLASGINGSYDNALGFLAEVDFRLGEFFYIGGKLTFIDYEPQQANAKTVDGNSVGIVMGFIFGD
ncbi:hypothetical protein MNBD_GAMMA22-1202 [hydrothermal vent metagenome]|uniref:Outer membrane protein beta-barrel domain-containing protein n=1 Tax=hydrothermal vent metagenome TaxID=652676 RepID=A0A3B1AZC2_9ZZZZ